MNSTFCEDWHPLALSQKVVHIWVVRRAGECRDIEGFRDILSQSEHNQAEKLRSAHAKQRFIVSRVVLRLLLGRYCGANPGELQFHCTSRGKPFLRNPSCVSFSISHSGPTTLLGFMVGKEFGVDVEQVRPIPEALTIAHRFFCQEEAADLESVPPKIRDLAFLKYWTRKEAYLKATGQGLSVPLNSFRVSAHLSDFPDNLDVQADFEQPREWTVQDLGGVSSLGPELAACVAYRDSPKPVILFPLADPNELLKGKNSSECWKLGRSWMQVDVVMPVTEKLSFIPVSWSAKNGCGARWK